MDKLITLPADTKSGSILINKDHISTISELDGQTCHVWLVTGKDWYIRCGLGEILKKIRGLD